MVKRQQRALKPHFLSKKRAGSSAVCLLLLAMAVYGNLFRVIPGSVGALAIDHSGRIAAVAMSATTKPVPTDLPVVDLVHAQPAPTHCTITGSYNKPDSLIFDVNSATLTTVIDTPSYYQVYGTSLVQLRNNVQSCAYRATVAGDYHAVTARQINWSYSTTQTGDVCTLRDLHIGLHIAQLLPSFVPNASTPSAVTAAWNTYAANLAVHEDGHVALANRYTQELAAKLQSIGPMRCSLLASHVEVTITSQLTLLNSEDTLYDSRTNHGATQGAVL